MAFVIQSWVSPMEAMHMNALFIGESRRAWWHLARRLEQRGCNCWFASTNEELRVLLDERPFALVLSAHPVTQGRPLMELLQAPERFVFYWFPVEDGCLWFQAIPEISNVAGVSALRPREFVSVLDALLSSGKTPMLRTGVDMQTPTQESGTFR